MIRHALAEIVAFGLAFGLAFKPKGTGNVAPGPAASRLLLADGTSLFLLVDGASALIINGA